MIFTADTIDERARVEKHEKRAMAWKKHTAGTHVFAC